MSEDGRKRVRVVISGRVQGVSFRYWTEQEARRRGLDGWVRNRHDGTVEALFVGEAAMVEDMVEACREGPLLARVTGVEAFDSDEAVGRGFGTLPTA